jgi:hypothetical protein
MSSVGGRWVRFLGWGLVGVCVTLVVSQIGLFTLPIGLVLALIFSRGSRGREMLGLLEGAGGVSAVIGLVNLNYRPCSGGPLLLQPGQSSISCGGFDGIPWLIAGLATMTLAAAVYWRLSRS